MNDELTPLFIEITPSTVIDLHYDVMYRSTQYHYSLFHSSTLIFRFKISSTSRIIIRSCGTEYSALEGIVRR